MLNVFVGYDPRQPVAAAVAAHSISERSSIPVAVTRLQLPQLPITRRGLTEFTYSRFLVPFLSGYRGISVFVDADVLCLDNIADLIHDTLLTANQARNVWVVKNERRFEWASLMVFDNVRCQMLAPAFVNDPMNSLFDFKWATDGVGELSKDWNHLVGYDPPNPHAKIVHFTQGIPIWPETKDCEYADAWRKEFDRLRSSVNFATLMGQSVHVEHMKQAAG